jgi:hypothetical protein
LPYRSVRVVLTCCMRGYSLNCKVTPERCELSSSPKGDGRGEGRLARHASMKVVKVKRLAGLGWAGITLTSGGSWRGTELPGSHKAPAPISKSREEAPR